MIIGLGIDLVELDRIERALQRHGRRFLERVLILSELDCLPYPDQPDAPANVAYTAARFAAKEAGVKALGTGVSQGVNLRQIEVVRPRAGVKPKLALHDAALERFRELGADTGHVSLSHGKNTATAVVILERAGHSTS